MSERRMSRAASAATGRATAAVPSAAAARPPAMAALLTVLLFLRPRGVLDRHLFAGLEPLHDLDLVHAGESGLDRAELELLLPLVLVVELGRGRVLGPRREHAPQESAGARGLRRFGLLEVDD